MNVRCERCTATYFLDDGLVGTGGTTALCPICGYRVPIAAINDGQSSAGLDKWYVTAADGGRFVFEDLAALQSMIATGALNPEDELDFGSAHSRPLGMLSGLEPFFQNLSRVDRSSVTPPYGFDLSGRRVSALEAGILQDQEPDSKWEVATWSDMCLNTADPTTEPSDGKQHTLRPPGLPLPRLQSFSVSAEEPPPEPNREPPSYEPAPPPEPSEPIAVPPASGLLPNSCSAAQSAPAPHTPPTSSLPPSGWCQPQRATTLRAGPDDTVPPTLKVTRPRLLGTATWIAGCALAFGALAVGLLHNRMGHQEQPPKLPSIGAEIYIRQAEQSFASGQLDEAKENYDRAGALVEHDTRVLVGMVRLAVADADLAWIQTRLVTEPDDRRAWDGRLIHLAARACAVTDQALQAFPVDAEILRNAVDARRIAGELDKAKALARGLDPQDQSNHYALALLRWADTGEVSPEVLQGLRDGLAYDAVPIRAQSALVLALGSAGMTDEAYAQLDRLGKLVQWHPLSAALRGWIQSKSSSSPVLAATAPTPRRTASSSEAVGHRALLRRARAALQEGELERARCLYEQVLRSASYGSEALVGLGDIARAEHNPSLARELYSRAIVSHPSQLSPLLALADLEWEEGDRTAGAARYSEILRRFPSERPSRAKARVDSEANRVQAPPLPASSTTANPVELDGGSPIVEPVSGELAPDAGL